MTAPLVPCDDCSRHVRASETHCPFCGALVASDAAAGAVPATAQRLNRTAMFVFGLTIAAAGCASNSASATSEPPAPTQPPSGGASSGGSTGATDPGTVTPGGDAGGPVSVTPSGPPGDQGTVHALYGVPSPR